MTRSVIQPLLDVPPVLNLATTTIPGTDDGVYRSMYLADPFVDPPNTFRALTTSDMFFIVPDRGLLSRLEFDVGIPPDIGPFIFSIQNRTVNAVLRVNLTLPSYLRSSMGLVFDVPPVGDTTTPSTTAGGFGGAQPGEGRVNVELIFSEAQAKTLNSGEIGDQLIFDIFHRDELTGPVFVSTTIQEPGDLNA